MDVDANHLAWIEAKRRVVRLVLALEASWLEKGTLPESLDSLVGPYFDRLPMDPVTGKPFHYMPRGLPFPSVALTYNYDWQEVPAGTPLLASSNFDVALSTRGVYDEFNYYPSRPEKNIEWSTTWQATRLLPLPPPGI